MWWRVENYFESFFMTLLIYLFFPDHLNPPPSSFKVFNDYLTNTREMYATALHITHINKVNSSIIIRIAHKSSFATINQWKYVIQMKNGTRFSVFLFFFPLNSYNKHSCNLFRILNAFLVIYHYVIWFMNIILIVFKLNDRWYRCHWNGL